MFWGETEMGSVDRDAVGRGWGFLVAPRKEAVVGQGDMLHWVGDQGVWSVSCHGW
jgi:hypothetical protein